jgi:pyruvate dehydrogenase E2 component (dihydrolipoamide acetyltransferase)
VREFPLPDLGEGLTEGEIIKWLVAEGDVVSLNQPIVEVETAKAAVEIPAKWAGKVVHIHHPEGATVAVGDPIIAIDTEPDAGDLPEGAVPARAAAEPAETAGTDSGSANGRTAVLVGYGPRNTTAARRPRVTSVPTTLTPPVPSPAPAPPMTAPVPAVTSKSTVEGPALAKPPVRKLARELGVDLTTLTGSGPSGSITRDDVHAAVGAAATVGTDVARLRQPSTVAVFGPNREHRVPVRGIRKLTAQNTVASAFTAPHVTEFLSVDVTRSMKALDRLRERPDWRGVRVSPLLLVAKAVLLAIGRHPMVNSTWSGETDEIIVKEYVNLGIAAATPRGLIVPNVKDAGRLSLRELADAMTELVGTAKDGRTAPADMTGGTFTITNVGVFGVDTGTPILPPGEAAILAFGAVRPMPWVHKGKVRVRQVTTLGLSFDHRIIDGELGSMFLRDVGSFLSDPEGSLLAWA